MNWNNHSNLEGKHALLSPSGYHWINYSDEEMYEKLSTKYYSSMRVPAGTAIHEFAARAITMKEKLPKTTNNIIKSVKYGIFGMEGVSQELVDFISVLPKEVFETLRIYVEDCIGFRMEPEKLLHYTDNCFGTADAISFEGNILRISDLKTGDTPAHMEQLFVYDALFCLEYHFRPDQIKIENRLYQFGEVQELLEVPSELILDYMNNIIKKDKIIQQIRGRE